MRSERGEAQAPNGASPAEGGGESRYRENLARDLIGISRDLQTRLRSELGARGGRA